MPGNQIDVGLVLTAVDKASGEIVKVEESLKGLGDSAKGPAEQFKATGEAAGAASEKAVSSFNAANKSAIEHGREVKTMAKEYKLANMEQILVAGMLESLGGKVKAFGTQFKGSTDLMSQGLKGVFEWMGKVNPAFSAALGTGLQLIGSITQMYSSYMQLSVMLGRLWTMKMASAAATTYHTIANWAHAVSQWAVNAAMYACPIVWIIAIIVALIAIIILLVQNWDKVSKAFGDFGNWAKKGLGDAWNGITKWCGDVGKAMGNAWDGIKNGAQGANDWIKNIFEGTAKKAYEWGQALIKAFNDGMQAAKKWLEDGCKNIGDSIAKFFKGASPPKEGPLSNIDKWGENLTMTLGQGITRGIPRVESLINSAGTSITNNRNNQVSAEINISGVDEERIARRVIDLLSEAMG